MLMNKVPYVKVVVGLMLLNLGQWNLTVVFALVFCHWFIRNIILLLTTILDETHVKLYRYCRRCVDIFITHSHFMYHTKVV